jgi:hypothetical protein
MAEDQRLDGGVANRDRYAAIVAALLHVRSDDASGRFDDEVAKAVADHRLDASTARTLRWWQRTSVRAAESYAAAVVSDLLAARDHAEATARRDVDEAEATWAAARALTESAGETSSESDDELPHEEPQVAESQAGESLVGESQVAELPVAELAAVRLLTPRQRTPESTRAIRIALARGTDSSDADANRTPSSGSSGMKATAPWISTDLVTTTISTNNPTATTKPTHAPSKGKEHPGHANPATSA